MPEIQGSSTISEVDMNGDTLRVTFQSGKTYEYQGVPADTMINMLQADSAGQYFGSEIRPNFDGVLVDSEADHPDPDNSRGVNQ